MTSITKLEVHNILHCHQMKTEPQPHVTYTGNLVKFGLLFFATCQLTRHTDTLIAVLHTSTGAESNNC